MRIDSSKTIKAEIQAKLIKKSQEIVKNQIGYILDKNMENIKAIEETAKFTGAGNNLDIKA